MYNVGNIVNYVIFLYGDMVTRIIVIISKCTEVPSHYVEEVPEFVGQVYFKNKQTDSQKMRSTLWLPEVGERGMRIGQSQKVQMFI